MRASLAVALLCLAIAGTTRASRMCGYFDPVRDNAGEVIDCSRNGHACPSNSFCAFDEVCCPEESRQQPCGGYEPTRDHTGSEIVCSRGGHACPADSFCGMHELCCPERPASTTTRAATTTRAPTTTTATTRAPTTTTTAAPRTTTAGPSTSRVWPSPRADHCGNSRLTLDHTGRYIFCAQDGGWACPSGSSCVRDFCCDGAPSDATTTPRATTTTRTATTTRVASTTTTGNGPRRGHCGVETLIKDPTGNNVFCGVGGWACPANSECVRDYCCSTDLSGLRSGDPLPVQDTGVVCPAARPCVCDAGHTVNWDSIADCPVCVCVPTSEATTTETPLDCRQQGPRDGVWEYGPWSEWSNECPREYRFRATTGCTATCGGSCGEPDQVEGRYVPCDFSASNVQAQGGDSSSSSSSAGSAAGSTQAVVAVVCAVGLVCVAIVAAVRMRSARRTKKAKMEAAEGLQYDEDVFQEEAVHTMTLRSTSDDVAEDLEVEEDDAEDATLDAEA